MYMAFILPLSVLRAEDVPTAGGKAAQLGEISSFGLPVPPGFVVTTTGFRNDSEEFKSELLKTFDELGQEYVAVRSSATCEDSVDASWAGELETYLNVDKGGLLEAVRNCWASIDSDRALAYRRNLGLAKGKVAVIVQEMVDADVAGVCFTVHPVTRNEGHMVIEAGFGLGETVVSGMITPDNYVVDKESLKIEDSNVNTQKMKITTGGEEQLSPEEGSKQKLSEEKIVELASLCKKIEKHYGFPQDIEWAVKDGEIFILQARPVTTL